MHTNHRYLHGRGRAGLLLALAGLVAGSAGCHRRAASVGAASELPAANVRVVEAASGVHRTTEDVVGSVRARLRAAIEAKASGRILRVLAAPGDLMEAGAPLVELDAREIQARVEQARAVLRQAEQDLDRFRSLLKDEAITRAEFDAQEARQRIAAAALQEAEATLGNTRVVAPFAGVVTRKLADVGDMAQPGRPLLELEDPRSLRFEADAPVALLGRVKLGEMLAVRIASMTGSVTGRVSEIEPSADLVSRTFRVKLDLPEGAGTRAGLFGRVAFPAGDLPVTTVPTNAVRTRGQLELAFVVAEGRARLRLVKTGKHLGGDLEILSGVEPGEKVVVSGIDRLVDGQPVVIQ